MVQKLTTELLALKRQMAQGMSSAPSYRDMPRRTFPNQSYQGSVAKNQGQPDRLPPPQGKLALEAPLTNSTVGYLETKHALFPT